MADNATLARPYAEALFRVAKVGDVNQWTECLEELAELSEHKDIAALVKDPNFTKYQIVHILLARLKSANAGSNELSNLVTMLVENRRISLLPEIKNQFIELKNSFVGSSIANITSAFEMSEAQVNELVPVLEKKFGCKIIPKVIVDTSLIGGIRVEVGDEVWDVSVRTKLERMRESIVS